MVSFTAIIVIFALLSLKATAQVRNQLRIVSSSSRLGGRLEIYYYVSGYYAWRPFCYNYFGYNDANLACKKLGYQGVSTYGRVGTYGYYQGSGSYSVRADCSSYNSAFDFCSISSVSAVSSCSHYNDVGINCYGSSTSSYSTTSSPSTTRLRLISSYSSSYYSSSSSGGRLEIYYTYRGYSAWRPFCSTSFNSHEADLACKKLGYRRASSYGRVGYLGYYRSSSTYSVIANCYSSTTSIDYCSMSVTSSCSNYYDVAVNCVDSVGSDSSAVGIFTGIFIGIPLAIIFICFGISVCSVVLYMKCYKRQPSTVRTRNVAENIPDYKMSEVAAKESNVSAYVSASTAYVGAPAPPYDASAYSTQPQQKPQVYPAGYGGAPGPAPPYTPTAYSSQPQHQPQECVQASPYNGNVSY